VKGNGEGSGDEILAGYTLYIVGGNLVDFVEAGEELAPLA